MTTASPNQPSPTFTADVADGGPISPPIEPKKPRKPGVRPKPLSKRSRKRRPPWHEALFPLICTEVIHAVLTAILAEGVKSKADLRAKLEKAIDGSVPPPILNRMLKECGFDQLFTQKTLITLKPPTGFQLAQPVDLTKEMPRSPGRHADMPGQMPLWSDDPELNTDLPPQMKSENAVTAPTSGGGAVPSTPHSNTTLPSLPPDPFAPVPVHGAMRTVI